MEEKLEDLKLLIEAVKGLNTTTAIIIISVIIIIAVSQAIFGSYLKKKFQYLATTENFDQLKEQLSDNTKVVEDVKASVQSDVWLSQQVWTKKHESYEFIITYIFEMKALLNTRLNQNSQWLKDITKENVGYDLDKEYENLIDFSSYKDKPTFINKLETLEENIIAKSVFLTSDFQSIELEIKSIKLVFISFEDTIVINESLEKVIERISRTLTLKVSILEKAISNIKVISSKDLIINLSGA